MFTIFLAINVAIFFAPLLLLIKLVTGTDKRTWDSVCQGGEFEVFKGEESFKAEYIICPLTSSVMLITDGII